MKWPNNKKDSIPTGHHFSAKEACIPRPGIHLIAFVAFSSTKGIPQYPSCQQDHSLLSKH